MVIGILTRLPPFPMLDEHTLHYAHLQSNKETTMWTCAFSLYISSTLQMAVSIRNNSVSSFFEECVLWRVFGVHLITLYNNNNNNNNTITTTTTTNNNNNSN